MHYFETIICADDTKEHTPSADPLLKYMGLSNIERENILYIGDSIYDSKYAQNTDIHFALALWGRTIQQPIVIYTKDTLFKLTL